MIREDYEDKGLRTREEGFAMLAYEGGNVGQPTELEKSTAGYWRGRQVAQRSNGGSGDGYRDARQVHGPKHDDKRGADDWGWQSARKGDPECDGSNGVGSDNANDGESG
ncbi:uncharacterized protein IUM83_18794 [Phytophthora cinnamomi]|uniref:uncharacterized protein n=1 Tax=Phytophthora cinnamomi TaxID=4785 RepID=UPI00355A1C13|nr:hypothetical protein IUM83_18794 [Phytophthora cinnamomi]